MIYAVGDIHGQDEMLARLLAHFKAELNRDDDLVVFLGDYIDRGPGTSSVIQQLIDFGADHPQTVFLRGNHEQIMLDSRGGPAPMPTNRPGRYAFSEIMANWFENGGLDTLKSYPLQEVENWFDFVPPEHWEFIENTQIEFITENYHFVHAGLLPPGEAWEGALWGIDPRLWIREPFLGSRSDFDGRLVVFGHTPQRIGRPLIRENMLGIDTAAAYGGPLTTAVLDPDRQGPPRFVQFWPDGELTEIP